MPRGRKPKDKTFAPAAVETSGEVVRFQAILNGRYWIERPAVENLLWARSLQDADGQLLVDRIVLREALIALREKWDENYVPPQAVPTGQATVQDLEKLAYWLMDQIHEGLEQAIERGIEQAMNGLSAPPQGTELERFKQDVKSSTSMQVSNTISTSHLTGESFKWNPDEDEG